MLRRKLQREIIIDNSRKRATYEPNELRPYNWYKYKHNITILLTTHQMSASLNFVT